MVPGRIKSRRMLITESHFFQKRVVRVVFIFFAHISILFGQSIFFAVLEIRETLKFGCCEKKNIFARKLGNGGFRPCFQRRNKKNRRYAEKKLSF